MSDINPIERVVLNTVLVPCPHCGHKNRPARSPTEVCKLYLTDTLPPCKKCSKEIRKFQIGGLKDNSVYMKRARRELEAQGIHV